MLQFRQGWTSIQDTFYGLIAEASPTTTTLTHWIYALIVTRGQELVAVMMFKPLVEALSVPLILIVMLWLDSIRMSILYRPASS